MKRLTISMSDELFDKLEVIENKSLFIRKLIERELDALENSPSDEVLPWPERFAILKEEVNTISSRLEMIETNFPGRSNIIGTQDHTDKSEISGHMEESTGIENVESEIMPDLEEKIDTYTTDSADEVISAEEIDLAYTEQPGLETAKLQATEKEKKESAISEPVKAETARTTPAQESKSVMQVAADDDIHEATLSEMVAEKISTPEFPQNDTDAVTSVQSEETVVFEMPESKPPIQTEQTAAFEMPELKPPEKAEQETLFIMPELKPPEQAEQETPFEMPELKPPEQAEQETPFTMPKLKPPEQTEQETPFTMPELKPPEQAEQETPFEMPELKPPEQAEQETPFTMPKLKPPEQTEQETPFEMPELKPQEQAEQETPFEMPELKPQEQAEQETPFAMPELKPPEQAEQETPFAMPELKPQEQAEQETPFAMPELKPQEQAEQETPFAMPELKPPEQAEQETPFTMPELKPPEQAKQETPFAMPELKPPEQVDQETPFAMPELKPPEGIPAFSPDAAQSNAGLPPFETSQIEQAPPIGEVAPMSAAGESTIPQMQPPAQPAVATPAPDTKPDKLESNILMYMPKGAKVKKEIIKSLVSRQFSQDEIDRKIQEMVAREVLVLKMEDGIEQLHRLK